MMYTALYLAWGPRYSRFKLTPLWAWLATSLFSCLVMDRLAPILASSVLPNGNHSSVPLLCSRLLAWMPPGTGVVHLLLTGKASLKASSLSSLIFLLLYLVVGPRASLPFLAILPPFLLPLGVSMAFFKGFGADVLWELCSRLPLTRSRPELTETSRVVRLVRVCSCLKHGEIERVRDFASSVRRVSMLNGNWHVAAGPWLTALHCLHCPCGQRRRLWLHA
jgi:hypothetical protein